MVSLSVKKRAEKDSGKLRAGGVLPAVVYGSKEASTPIEIPLNAFERVWKEAGETTIVVLQGLEDEKQTLIQEVQTHPVTGRPVHADFYAIEKGQKLEVAIPLHFVHEAPAEKAGHIIVKAMHEIEIEVEPAELPHSLDVDISGLKEIGDHILARDVKLPPSAKLKVNPEDIVVTVSEAKEEKIEAPAPVAPVEGAMPAEGAPAPEAPETASSEVKPAKPAKE